MGKLMWVVTLDCHREDARRQCGEVMEKDYGR